MLSKDKTRQEQQKSTQSLKEQEEDEAEICKILAFTRLRKSTKELYVQASPGFNFILHEVSADCELRRVHEANIH